MSFFHGLNFRLRALFRKRDLEREMQEEMRFHLEQRAAERADEGLSPEEARRAALRKFGNVGSLQERGRAARGWTWLESFGKDLRLALRALLGSPGFVLLAVITLGLGIGANTAMYSVFLSIARRPLPYPEVSQLERIYRSTAQNKEGEFSAADYLDFRAAGGAYQVAAQARAEFNLADAGRPPEVAAALRISANLLGLLGVQPQLGRDFRPEEDAPGRERVLVISHRYWKSRFGQAPDIIGRQVRIDGVSHEIVGVLPASFNDWRHLGWVDVFRPLALTPAEATDRVQPRLRFLARRSTSVTPEQGAAFVSAFARRLAAEHPAENAESSWWTESLAESVVGNNGPMTLAMLIGLSGFVLLIACSNLANFLLARTMARAREYAVRAALGASRLQLLRPLAAESLLLALGGGACALGVAYVFLHWMMLRSTGDNGEMVPLGLDWPVLTWAFLASLFTALAFGLAPALFALRLNVQATLKSGARGSTGGRFQQRLRQLLIVGQFALAMILLVGAALFVRGLAELNTRRAGWESDGLVTATVLLPGREYPGAAEIDAFQRETRARLEALPGVQSVSLSGTMPFFGFGLARKFVVQGRELPKAGQEPAAVTNAVSPRYFETVGTRLLQGREFADSDQPDAPRVFIVNQAMAQGLFPGESAVGRRLGRMQGSAIEWGEIVGVVADVKSVYAEKDPVAYQLYQPVAQEAPKLLEIGVRARGTAAAALVDPIRAAMTERHPDLPLRRLQPANARIERANYQLGVLRDLLGCFALLGLGLATLGVYGVIARTMAQRAPEFGIRLALGARVRDITRLVLASGLKLALLGVLFGLAGGYGVSQLLASGYPGMQLENGPAMGGVALLLVCVALLASYLPARRAAGINPMETLRAD
ncbi:MAG: ABC transporter permease [Verrucomicrobia bacterium]|nr:ABC transporter permease [Verrucomicrobiota bacterium]